MSVAFTVDLDWAGEAAISELLDFLRDRAIPTTVFTTHRSARVEAAFDELEVGVHPHFGTGSSHGATIEEVVHNVLALPHNVPGFRCHRFATSNEIVGALHAAGLQFGSNICTDLDPLPPFRDRFGLWQFPVFLEDGGYLYRRRSLAFDDGDVAGALAGPGLHVLLLHPMHFALNTPDFAFMRSHKDALSPSEWQAQSRDQLDARRHRGLGIRDFLVALTDYVARAAIPITTLGRVYDMLTGSSTA